MRPYAAAGGKRWHRPPTEEASGR